MISLIFSSERFSSSFTKISLPNSAPYLFLEYA
ncbi:MAG: hypothetical protein K5894_08235 [Lachnospiraceae bacterium]|nr:hypothetical protein [Lachnospiraceae bacterium]